MLRNAESSRILCAISSNQTGEAPVFHLMLRSAIGPIARNRPFGCCSPISGPNEQKQIVPPHPPSRGCTAAPRRTRAPRADRARNSSASGARLPGHREALTPSFQPRLRRDPSVIGESRVELTPCSVRPVKGHPHQSGRRRIPLQPLELSPISPRQGREAASRFELPLVEKTQTAKMNDSPSGAGRPR